MRSLGSRSSNFPSSFSKQSLPLRGLCFFLVLPCGFVQMHRGSSSRSLRSISLFSRLPACVARLPAVQRDVSQKSRVIFRKTWSNRGKHGGFFPITPQFLAFSYADARRIPVHTELVRGGETSSSDFMHKLRCFLPFSVRGQIIGEHISFTSLQLSSPILQQNTFTALIITTISKFTTQNTHM